MPRWLALVSSLSRTNYMEHKSASKLCLFLEIMKLARLLPPLVDPQECGRVATFFRSASLLAVLLFVPALSQGQTFSQVEQTTPWQSTPLQCP